MTSAARQELFGVDPNEFVATRDRLVRELRASGEKDEAAALTQLRRPTVTIWALNQVARTDAPTLAALTDASRNAHDAQEKVLGGADGRVLRDAVTARRGAIRAVVATARRVIDASGRPSDAQERELENALNAIVDSERLSEQLLRGELTALDTDDIGGDDDLLANLSGSVGGTTRRPRASTSKPATREPSARLLRAQEKLARHRGEEEEAADRLRDAEQQVEEAEATVGRAERALAVARRTRDAAQKQLERAEHARARSEDEIAGLDA